MILQEHDAKLVSMSLQKSALIDTCHVQGELQEYQPIAGDQKAVYMYFSSSPPCCPWCPELSVPTSAAPDEL